MAIPAKIVELYRRWNAKFPIPTGEDNVRQWQHRFNEQVAYSFPNEGFCTKQASETRPISKDTTSQAFPIGCRGYDHVRAVAWDMIAGAGSSSPRPIYGGNTEHDIHNPAPQWVVQVTPNNHLQEEPEEPPVPVPPTKDRIKLIELRNDIDEYLRDNPILP